MVLDMQVRIMQPEGALYRTMGEETQRCLIAVVTAYRSIIKNEFSYTIKK